MRKLLVLVWALVTVLVLAACAPEHGGTPATVPPAIVHPTVPPSTPMSTDDPVDVHPGRTRTVADELQLPWSLVRLPSGVTLVSERDTASIVEIDDSGAARVVGTVPGVVPGGEGGLLGLAVSTDRPEHLFAYTTTAIDNRVLRIPLIGKPGSFALGAATPVLTGIPKADNHNGGRIHFGPDGLLYVTAGDAGNTKLSQNLDSLAGKILRITPDGAIPADNPFGGSPVYSFGHRNPQGIAWDDEGRMWASEFGQNRFDELNLITPGANYGWPIVEGMGAHGRFVNPVQVWSPAEASPSGLVFSHGKLWLASLRGQRLWSIVATPDGVSVAPWFVGEFGRLRDVIDGPNGTLWMLTNNTGRSPRPGDDRIVEVELAPVG